MFPLERRQILLFISSVAIPVLVLLTLAVRVYRQDRVLNEKRLLEEQAAALDGVRRELSTRLELIKLRELQTLTQNPGLLSTPRARKSPVLFVSPIDNDRVMPLWPAAAAETSVD